MVIVTQNQYILASKIHHITMDENSSHEEVRNKNGKLVTMIERYYNITVIYSPEDHSSAQGGRGFGSSTNATEMRECSVVIRGAVNAHQVFKNLIQQIREQMPDQLYLDTALERMIAGIDIEALKDRDLEEEKKLVPIALEKKNDRSSKKIRGTRKKKRRNQKVLRGSKARNRSR